MRQVERVSQELAFNKHCDPMYVKTLTYSTGNLSLVIDTAALGVVVCFLLEVTLPFLTVLETHD